MSLLFTYGTLRRGERNHWVLTGGIGSVAFIREDFISAKRVGTWGTDIPLIEEEPGGAVLGEVYEVDDRKLWALDRFEGTADGVYERRQVTTHSGIEVWVYFPGPLLLEKSRQ